MTDVNDSIQNQNSEAVIANQQSAEIKKFPKLVERDDRTIEEKYAVVYSEYLLERCQAIISRPENLTGVYSKIIESADLKGLNDATQALNNKEMRKKLSAVSHFDASHEEQMSDPLVDEKYKAVLALRKELEAKVGEPAKALVHIKQIESTCKNAFDDKRREDADVIRSMSSEEKALLNEFKNGLTPEEQALLEKEAAKLAASRLGEAGNTNLSAADVMSNAITEMIAKLISLCAKIIKAIFYGIKGEHAKTAEKKVEQNRSLGSAFSAMGKRSKADDLEPSPKM